MSTENPITEEQYQYALTMIQYHEQKVDTYKAVTRKYHQQHEVIRIGLRDKSNSIYHPLYQYNGNKINT